MSLITVRAIDRSGWGSPAPYPRIVTVQISDRCAQCGGMRGTPQPKTFYENDETHTCDIWTNPCGHSDTYVNVLDEAADITIQRSEEDGE